MKKIYVKRIVRIIIFLITLIIVDQLIGLFIRKLYFNSRSGYFNSLTYTLRDCNEDILIFGASQAQHNYDTRILYDSIKLSCYNAGLDGGHSIIMQYAQIRIITKRYSPKVIILEFNPENIVRYPGDYDRLKTLLPFVSDFPELRPFIYLIGPFEQIKLFSAIYPVNSQILYAIWTNIHPTKRIDFNGYVPLINNGMTSELADKTPTYSFTEQIDNNMIDALKGIIEICNEKNIKLFIISSPTYHKSPVNTTLISEPYKKSMSIIKAQNTFFYDLSADSSFIGRRELFKDHLHLNEAGSKIFSQIVGGKIKQLSGYEKKGE